MSAKAISEYSGKKLLYNHLKCDTLARQPMVLITDEPSTVEDPSRGNNLSNLASANPWLNTERLVAKPDQLIKRRGKLGLLSIGKCFDETKAWVEERYQKPFTVGRALGSLKRFVVEPLVPHDDKTEEFYLCILSDRSGDTILFHHEGGVDIGDVDSKAVRLHVPVDTPLDVNRIATELLSKVAAGDKVSPHAVLKRPKLSDPAKSHDEAPATNGISPIDYNDNSSCSKKKADVSTVSVLTAFIAELYRVYCDLYFTYLEINPLVVKNGRVYILDLAAKLDQCAEFMCRSVWGPAIEFPTPFGREAEPEEAYIADLDAKSGASLKLTIINKQGRIWTMVAGGGASVIYADTICQLGGTAELANYGEYSGAPTEQQTYDYARTILGLMTGTEPHPDGKVLLIGGGIANFTNVAATFRGIIQALREFQTRLITHKVSIYVRRGGPNYQEGLRTMRETGQYLGVPVHVFGPETHMTSIVGMALGLRDPTDPTISQPASSTSNFLIASASGVQHTASAPSSSTASGCAADAGDCAPGALFTPTTKVIVWGMQLKAVQSMLDFDFTCQRAEPSVVAMTYPMMGDHKQKFYYGHKDILLPVYKSMAQCFAKHPDASVLVSFASLRSAYESAMEALDHPQIKCIAIIAEGIPENLTRKVIIKATKKGVSLIGPATVGGIKPGCVKIGNTGGMLDNILSAKLYRPGSVAYVSRSGGMSNELNNIVARHTDGLVEGIAIGGDRYPGSSYLEHIARYEADPRIKLLVLLGEVGGTEEYRIIDAMQEGKVTKPIVAWCYGTCADQFTSEVQFGHAGSAAHAKSETAAAKNEALKAAGCHVPASFDDLGDLIGQVWRDMVTKGEVVPCAEVTPPTVPMDYAWARELGLIRKPASFMSSVCDERGHELLYAGVPITNVIEQDMGIGGTLGLLWFQRRLPRYAAKFLEMCLMVTADHGPAVSGAHNTIVCARAGKDLISCLTSGLLTIGDRFGGALDGAANQFSKAYDSGQSPMEFVNAMRKKGELIMGIGHRVKSINNPDKRVVILKSYALKNFPSTPLIKYAEEVEAITTSKKPNLILNVDGLIGVAMVDMLRQSGCFSEQEANEYVEIGALNALFVLGRSVGFIGHFLDQKRLKQGLYRHPWDDITYIMPELSGGSGNVE